MSDAVRVYSSSVSAAGRRRRGHSPWRVRTIIVAAAVFGMVYLAWTTRDVYPIERFIPRGQRLEVVVVEPLAKRAAVAGSPVWDSMPAFTGLQRVPELLGQTTNVPPWVLNNCIGTVCHLSANDLHAFSDALFVTKMTHIGTLFERLHLLSATVARDAAGGLNLRKLADAEIYYAVRGRVLIVSPSRTMLIRALTVPPDEALPPGAVSRAQEQVGREDLSGTVVLTGNDPLGGVLSSLSFALAVEEQGIELQFQSVVNDAWKARIAEAFGAVTPLPLTAPPDGVVALSVNVGAPVRETMMGLGKLFDLPLLSAEQWDAWAARPADAQPGLPYFLTTLTADLGPSLSLSVAGIDANAMLPVPELAGVFEGSRDAIDKAFAAFPPVPADTPAWASVPRVDKEQARAHVPMIGGPSIEPTAGVYGNGLLISSSATTADRLLAAGSPAQPALADGNIYVRVVPRKCVEAVIQVGNLLVDENLLRGYDAARFAADSDRWLASVGQIAEVSGTAGYNDGKISGGLKILVVP